MGAVAHSTERLPGGTRVRGDGYLDQGTLLDRPWEKCVVTHYPQAGEASVVRLTHPEWASERRPDPEPAELERRSEERAARRARSHVRRYTVANRCRFLWTLTEEVAVHDLEEAGRHLDAFLRRVREKIGPIPIVAVAELHPGGHGWHWHFATDRFISWETLKALWGRGGVWVNDGRGGAGPVTARGAAKYVCKYLAKTFSAQVPANCRGRRRGQHRYRLTQGFSPTVERVRVASVEAGVRWLELKYGRAIYRFDFAIVSGDEPDSCWLLYSERCLSPPPIACRS